MKLEERKKLNNILNI